MKGCNNIIFDPNLFYGYFYKALFRKSFAIYEPYFIMNFYVTIFDIYDFFVILNGFYPVSNSYDNVPTAHESIF